MKCPYLDIKNLTKIYNEGTIYEIKALNRVSFTMEKAEFLVLTGDNASGKSTLFNCISGTVMATEGTISLGDDDITCLSEAKRAYFIGRVWQNVNNALALSMTVYENLLMARTKIWNNGLKIIPKRAMRAEIENIVLSYGMGLEKKLNTRMYQLSGGEKQAIALVMATLCMPKLLLLDEHTAALDPENKIKIMKLTNNIVKNNHITTVMITHDMEEVKEYGDRVIKFEKGQIILDKKRRTNK